MKRLFIFLALAPTVLVACNRGHDKNPITAVTEASKDRELQKTWQGACTTELGEMLTTGAATLGQATVKSARAQYTFAGNNITRTIVYYAQADCAQDAWEFNERGVFKIETDPNKKSNDGGKNIDFDLRTVSLQVRDENGAKAANALKLCDKADWSANSKEFDVTAVAKKANCYQNDVPRKVPNIYSVEGKTLRFGNPSFVAKERPASLDKATFEAK